MPAVVACGSREQASKDFKKALATPDILPILLVDSERQLTRMLCGAISWFGINGYALHLLLRSKLI